MMRFKKAVGSILLGAAALAVSGCGGSKDVKQTNQSLSLCVDQIANELYQEAFDEYRETYPDVELNVEVYDEIIAGMSKVNTQIMAGEGPDLLLMKCYGTSDVYKMMRAQAFAPMDEFMEEDSDWKKEDYVKAAVDSGVYEGKQLIMPLSYDLPIAITSQENLEKAGISLDSCQDMAAFLQETAKFSQVDGMERVFMEPGQLSLYPEYLSHEFLDYSEGKLGIEEQKLQQACEAYKSFYIEDMETCSLPDNAWYGVGEMVAEGETGMYIPTSIMNFMAASQAVAANATPVIWPFKNEKGETMATIRDYAGIRANSENRQNAWNLLKIIMGDEMQEKIAKRGTGCPVQIAALQTAVDQIQKSTFEDGSDMAEMAELSAAVLQQYKDALMNPGNGIYATDTCIQKFGQYMKPYYEDTGSYEDSFAEFKKFISVYLTE